MTNGSMQPVSDAKTLAARDIRIALVGCGRISKNHFEAIERVDGLKLVSVCDVEEARAQGSWREQNACRGSRTSKRCWRKYQVMRL